MIKIVKNKETDTVNERNKKDLAKFQAFVEECNNNHLGNEQKVKSTALKYNRTQDDIEQQYKRSRVCKSSDIKQPLETRKQKQPAD